VYRREFLLTVGVAGATAGLSRPARGGDDPAARADDVRAARSPQTPNGTATGTPTPAAATPSTGFEPLGSVEVRDGTEAVVTPGGDTAFVAVGDGFAAVDVSEPRSPVVVGRETDISPLGADAAMGGVRDVKYDDGELLVAGPAGRDEGVFTGVALFDVTDPTDPTFRRAHATDFPVHNCYLADGRAYLTGNNRADNPLVIVDMHEGGELARWSLLDHDDRWADVSRGFRTLHDVWVHDGLAYLAYWDAGTWILDVSDPADPRYVANITAQSPEDLASKSGLDASRATGQPPGNDHYVATDGTGRLLAVGKETWDSGFGESDKPSGYEDTGGPSGVHLYDVSDPARPEKRSEIPPPPTADPEYAGVWTTAHNFDLHEGYLYSSWYRGGVRVHDVADPTDPRELAHFRRSRTTSFWTAQLARAGDFFVGTSYRSPQLGDRPATLYTFPDPRTTPTPTPAPTPTPTPTPTPDPTPATPASPGSTPDGGSGTTDGDDPRTTTGESGPGFGSLAGLTALGAWYLLDRDGGENE